MVQQDLRKFESQALKPPFNGRPGAAGPGLGEAARLETERLADLSEPGRRLRRRAASASGRRCSDSENRDSGTQAASGTGTQAARAAAAWPPGPPAESVQQLLSSGPVRPGRTAAAATGTESHVMP